MEASLSRSQQELFSSARAWMEHEDSAENRLLLTRWLEEKDISSLREAFGAPLSFGTAGLRGKVGPGPSRMNLTMVGCVSWALSRFLLSRESSSSSPRVVVGFDARPESQEYAKHAACIMQAEGLDVRLAESFLPTPIVAYAVRAQNAMAGVVVTASHNPRGDNGYKVYDDQGVQIVSPWDTEIAAWMARASYEHVSTLEAVPLAALERECIDAYFRQVDSSAKHWAPVAQLGGEVRLAYSPLHGVGLESVERALAPLGSRIRLETVSAQSLPDGTFPTLPFPNPEEDGALDLLLDTARELNCEAAFANDPDADRFALCLPLAGQELERLSGDALGLLFADGCLRRLDGAPGTLVATVVSSPALEALAQARGAQVERTLTGFKWICRAALEAPHFVCAYEEALGYCFAAPDGEVGVFDKDGVLACRLAAHLLLQAGGGRELGNRLLGLYQELGLWGSFGHSRRFSGSAARQEAGELMHRLRSESLEHLAGAKVVAHLDYWQGSDDRPYYLGRENLLQYELQFPRTQLGPVRGRLLIRPSGTEAKVKVYVHLCSELNDHSEYSELSRKQSVASAHLAEAVFELAGSD